MALLRCILGVAVPLLYVGFVAANQALGHASAESQKLKGVNSEQNLDLNPPQDLDLKSDQKVEDHKSRDLEPDRVEDQDSGKQDKDSGEPDRDSGDDLDSVDEDRLSVSEQLEKANKQLDGDEDIGIEDGDIAVPRPHHVQKRNADRCVRRGCKWPRSCNGKVYVPYVIANHYSTSQLQTIGRAFRSFAQKTCIRFVPRRKQRDYLYIHSSTGCWSYIGRRGRGQKLSLRRNGCVHLGIIQHELLHALGFHHEHKRSDRDRYVRVLWRNIRRRFIHNFRKTRTLNLGTPYDYGSIMHYSKRAFSKNGKPTLVARRCNVTFGRARKMSVWDIRRVNRLYCGNR